jgi:hypothetical protein
MSNVIKDGTGQAHNAKVDSTNRLLVEAVTESEQLEAAAKGNSYQIGSGNINLTSANASAVLYFKNNEDMDVILTAVNITSTKQTGATGGVFLATVYKNATGLSAGTDLNAVNSNFGSNQLLDSTITGGQEAATVIGGIAIGGFYIQEAEFFNTEIAWVIPKGSSVSLTITPAASNTSLNITTTLEGHIAREAL